MTNTNNTLSNFTKGCFAALTSFGKMFHPKVRLFIIIPLVINFLVFAGLFYYFAQYGMHKLDFLNLQALPTWLQWEWLGKIFVFIKGFLLLLYFSILLSAFTILATVCANIIGAPFNGLLSEAYSTALGLKPPPVTLLRLAISALKRESIKLLYYIPRAVGVVIIAVILYFVPVVNLAIPALFLWFSSWMLAVQYVDYPADNEQIPFKTTLKRMKKNKALLLGFGLTLTLLGAIPVVNLFVMPSAVLGATALWHEKIKTLPQQ